MFDLLVTPRRVFALFERLPSPGGGRPHFCYRVPVGTRRPADEHHCAVELDAARGRVTWWLDGRVAGAVDLPGGTPPDAAYLARGDGADATAAAPGGLAFGLGLLTERPAGQGIELTARYLRVSIATGRRSHECG